VMQTHAGLVDGQTVRVHYQVTRRFRRDFDQDGHVPVESRVLLVWLVEVWKERQLVVKWYDVSW